MMACISCLCLSGTGCCTFADLLIVYRDYFGSSVTHFRRASMRTTFLGFTGSCSWQPCSCCYGTDLKARPLHLISQRPILGHCLSGTLSLAGTFRDCEKPAKVPTQPAKNQTDSGCQ